MVKWWLNRVYILQVYCVCYCEDINIFINSDDPHDDLTKLQGVLSTLKDHEHLVEESKSELSRSSIEFFGFQISHDGWAPTESKLEAVVNWQATVKHLLMANLFILPVFPEKATPLTELLESSRPGHQKLKWSVECESAFAPKIEWYVECESAFARIKESLMSALVLRHFKFNASLRKAIHIDASQNAVGAVLLQWC